MEAKAKGKKSKLIIYIIPFVILLCSIIFRYWFFSKKIKYNYQGNMKEELFISIDFGNSKSSFAYNFGRNKKIVRGNIRSVPSIVILNKKNYSGKNYGTKSINSISNYDEEEMNKIIYIDNLKLSLFNMINQENNVTNVNSTTSFETSKAIIEYLKLFSDEIVKEINAQGTKYVKEAINWIITAPRFWDDYTKMNLINLAKEAGMINIELALDSEVASISVLNDKIIRDELKKNGKKFLLIDLGDHKIDISLNEIINNNIKELTIPLGGKLGSMNINNDLMKVVEEVFGKETLDKVKENQFDEYLQTLKGLEDIKKKYKENSSDYYETYAKFERKPTFFDKIKIIIYWVKRTKYFKEFNYGNYTIKIDDIKIYFPGKLIEDIIQRRVNEIIDYIKSINMYIKNYDYIVLTGGFANCGIFVNTFRKNFKNVHILSNQEYSVLEGALIYLNNKQRIYSIVSYNTYGIKINNSSNDLEILVKKGDIINSDFHIRKLIDNNSIESDFMIFNFYKSSNEKISEKDYFGTLEINLSDYNSKEINLILLIRFNTHLQIDVKDAITYKKVKFSFVNNSFK